MDQLKQMLASLSTRQRITILLSVLLTGAGLYGLVHWKRESDFRPLYKAMASEDAGAVVQKLKESGVEYRLSDDGGTVLVPSAKLAEVRLELAGAGLPKSGRIGFELFDKVNFGASEFVEHINYRRALEGELERSIMSLSEVEQARVHLTFPKESVFVESQQPAKASVLVKLRSGAQLSPHNVPAIANLVASAVEGLAPEAVSILDMRGNLLNRPRRTNVAGGDSSDEMLETRQRIEKDLVAKVNATLDPLLGSEKYRAAAFVECDFSSGDQSEELYDPAKSVMVTSQTTEDGSSSASSGGVPGTASNLPHTAGSRASSGSGGLFRRTENITYQTSRVTKQTHQPTGALKKMSLSVLVDHNVVWQGEGSKKRRVLVPPTPETLKAVHDLVAAATGFTAERGDQLIVESLPFESTLNVEMPVSAPPAVAPTPTQELVDALNKNKYPAAGVVTVVILLVAAGKVFGRNDKKKQVRRAPVPAPPAIAPASAAAVSVPDSDELRAAHMRAPAVAAQNAADRHTLEAPRLSRQQLVSTIREAVSKDAAPPANIVRAWLRESES